MDKKGMGWKTIIVIVIILISASAIMIWQVKFGKWIKGEDIGCKISFITNKDLSKLSCEMISVEIKADNSEDAKKELLGWINKMGSDFSLKKKFSENAGLIFKDTFCMRRYNPIIFENDLDVGDFKHYLDMNLPENLKNRVQVIPPIIDTSKVYNLVLVVVSQTYYNTWLDKGISGFVKSVAWKGVESDYIGFALVDVSEIDKLECDNPI